MKITDDVISLCGLSLVRVGGVDMSGVGLASAVDRVRWDFISPTPSLHSQFYYDLHVGCTYCLGRASSHQTYLVISNDITINPQSVAVIQFSFPVTGKPISNNISNFFQLIIHKSLLLLRLSKYWKTIAWEKKAVL